jgi:hypothetical protein
MIAVIKFFSINFDSCSTNLPDSRRKTPILSIKQSQQSLKTLKFFTVHGIVFGFQSFKR